MSNLISLIDELCSRCTSEADKPTIEDQQFTQLWTLINKEETFSDLPRLGELMLNDHIADLLFEDNYPESELNRNDQFRDIGESDLSAIFRWNRPNQIDILNKMYSVQPGARLFSIWFSTYERSDEKGIDYNQLVSLIFDKHAGVSNIAIRFVHTVASPKKIYEQIVLFFEGINIERQPAGKNDQEDSQSRIAAYLLFFLEQLNSYVVDADSNQEDTILNYVEYSLDEYDNIMSGRNWGKVMLMLKENERFLELARKFREYNTTGPFRCSCGINVSGVHPGNVQYWEDVECRVCSQNFCCLCLDQSTMICNTCRA